MSLPRCSFRTDKKPMLTGTDINVNLKSFKLLNQCCAKTGLCRLMLHHDNVLAHTTKATVDFPTEGGVQLIQHPPILLIWHHATGFCFQKSENSRKEPGLRALIVLSKLSQGLQTPLMSSRGLTGGSMIHRHVKVLSLIHI